MTPADCNLRDFPFQPVEVHRLLSSDTWVLGTGDQRAAAITLWLASWHQVPAGSIPKADPLLARLSHANAKWGRVKEHALRGWIEATDGRLYHPVVAEKALEAWIEKLAFSHSGTVGNAKRWGIDIATSGIREQVIAACDMLRALSPQSKVFKKKAVLSIVAGSPTESPPDTQKPSPPDSPTDSPTDRKGQGQGEGQGIDSVPTGTGAVAPAPEAECQAKAPVDMTKAELWKAGKSLLAEAGMPKAQCGSFVGKLVSDHGDAIVIEAVRTAVVQRPADPAEYLVALCRTASGLRKQPVQWWSTDETIEAKAKELGMKANPGEYMKDFKGRIEAAIANGGTPPAPTRSRAPDSPRAPDGGKSVMPEGLNLKALIVPRESA